MRRRYSITEKELVVKTYQLGHSIEKTSEIVNIPGTSVHRILKEYGICRSLSQSLSTSTERDDLFSTRDEVSDYWLGFLIADGYLDNQNTVVLNLSIKDEEHLDKYIDYTKANKLYMSNTQSVRAYFGNKSVTQTLKNLGLHSNKSMTVDITIPLNRDIVRGVFDGDGCVQSDKRKANSNLKFTIVTGSLVFAEKIWQWFKDEAGVTLNFNHWGSLYHIQTADRRTVKLIYNLLYSGSTVYLERKKTVFGSAVEKFTV